MQDRCQSVSEYRIFSNVYLSILYSVLLLRDVLWKNQRFSHIEKHMGKQILDSTPYEVRHLYNQLNISILLTLFFQLVFLFSPSFPMCEAFENDCTILWSFRRNIILISITRTGNSYLVRSNNRLFFYYEHNLSSISMCSRLRLRNSNLIVVLITNCGNKVIHLSCLEKWTKLTIFLNVTS
jgi:hypothetical protein